MPFGGLTNRLRDMSDTCAPLKGKIPALHEATEAVGESKEPQVTVKKACEGNGKLEERDQYFSIGDVAAW